MQSHACCGWQWKRCVPRTSTRFGLSCTQTQTNKHTVTNLLGCGWAPTSSEPRAAALFPGFPLWERERILLQIWSATLRQASSNDPANRAVINHAVQVSKGFRSTAQQRAHVAVMPPPPPAAPEPDPWAATGRAVVLQRCAAAEVLGNKLETRGMLEELRSSACVRGGMLGLDWYCLCSA